MCGAGCAAAGVVVLCGRGARSAGGGARRGFTAGPIKSGLIIASRRAVCAWAVPLGKARTPPLRALCHWPFVPARHLSILLVAMGLLAAGYLLGTLLSAKYLGRHGGLGRKARLLGMGTGIVEGILLSATAFAALLAVETPARMGLSMIMDDNAAARGVYDQLVFLRSIADSTTVGKKLAEFSKGQREVLEMGGSLAIISRYDGAIDKLKNHPFIVQVLAENTAISRITREIRNDQALKLAVKTGDLRAMLNSSTVARLMDDLKLAREVQRYRDELFGAVMVSVPFEYREEANAELAKLHGMPVKEFLVYASKRVAALADRIKARARQEFSLPGQPEFTE